MEPASLSPEETLEAARIDVAEKYASYLAAEVQLTIQGGGFFEKKYWDDFITSKLLWQRATNNFYTLLHELAK